MKPIRRVMSLLLCVVLMLSITVLASAHDMSEDTGTAATIGPERPGVREGDNLNLHTDFYLRVENPKTDVSGSNLPKTGDSGVRLETLLIVALLCGGGYLACEIYDKKRKD